MKMHDFSMSKNMGNAVYHTRTERGEQLTPIIQLSPLTEVFYSEFFYHLLFLMHNVAKGLLFCCCCWSGSDLGISEACLLVHTENRLLTFT